MKKQVFTQASKSIPKRILKRVQGEDGIARKMLRIPQLEMKSMDPGAPMTISGFANEITPDRGAEIIPKEAWSLENYQKNPIILWEHMPWEPVGSCMVLNPTDEGLKFEAKLGDPTAGHELTARQKDVRSLVAQGVLRSLSVGFIPWEWEYDEKTDLLVYKKCELLEISIVSIPMQQNSQINEIKRFIQECQIVDNEDGKKPDEDEVGFSREMLEGMKKMLEENTEMTRVVTDYTKSMYEKMGCGGAPKEDDEEKSALRAQIVEKDAEIEKLKGELVEADGYVKALHKRLDDLMAVVNK